MFCETFLERSAVISQPTLTELQDNGREHARG